MSSEQHEQAIENHTMNDGRAQAPSTPRRADRGRSRRGSLSHGHGVAGIHASTAGHLRFDIRDVAAAAARTGDAIGSKLLIAHSSREVRGLNRWLKGTIGSGPVLEQ